MNQDWDKESFEWSEDEEEDLSTDSELTQEPSGGKTKKKRTKFQMLLQKISVMDIIIAFVGVIVVIAAIALGITLKNKADIAKAEEQEFQEITGMYGKDTEISVVFESYCRDLQIKFINKGTGKLIANVDFEIDIISPAGEESIWVDEDEDGIIYYSDLTPGSYTVSMASKNMFKYSTSSKDISVKNEYDFQKTEIMCETLTEGEIDKSVEDALQVNEQSSVGATLQDTVQWVESTVVEIPYIEIDKSKIINPDTKLNLTIASNTEYEEPSVFVANAVYASKRCNMFIGNTQLPNAMRQEADRIVLASAQSGTTTPTTPTDVVLKASSVSLTVGQKVTIGLDATSVTDVKWELGDPQSTIVSVNGTTGEITALAVGTAIVKARCISDPNLVKDCTVTVTAPVVTVSKTEITSTGSGVRVGEILQLTGKVTYSDATVSTTDITWSSANTAYATVEATTGKVTGVAAGQVVIYATSTKDNSKVASITVIVSDAIPKATAITVTPDKATLNWKTPLDVASMSTTLTANVTLSQGVDKSVVWTSSDTNVVTVDAYGKVTGVGPGCATITATTVAVSANEPGKKLSASAIINVNGFTMTIDHSAERILEGTSFTITPTMTNYPTGSITWTSSNQSVASVTNGVVTGISSGTATITATSVDKDLSGRPIAINCSVTVVRKPQNDTSTALINKSGKQIFVEKSSGEYVKATSSDYYKTGAKYYVSTDGLCEYTGWQTFDDGTYYYGPDKKPVTGTQVIRGIKYQFDDKGVLQNNYSYGLDVSSNDDAVDFQWAAQQGMTFAMIRCGYRGAVNHEVIQDAACEENIKAAQEAGMSVGLYFESQATDVKQAIDEASMAIAIADKYEIYNCKIFMVCGKGNESLNAMNAASRTVLASAFCQTVQNNYYSAGVMGSASWIKTNLNTVDLGENCMIWISEYVSELNYNGKCDLWQQGMLTQDGKSVRRNVWMQGSYDYTE